MFRRHSERARLGVGFGEDFAKIMPSRRSYDRDVEHTGVLAVVQDSDMRSACVFCGLTRDHAAGIVILLKVNGVGRADY